MKKVLIVMTSLYNGGAEKSLVNLLNEMKSDKYEIDLLLFKRSGMFLEQLPSWVNVLETPRELKALYTPEILRKKSVSKILCRYVGTAVSQVLTSNSRERKGMRWKYFYSNQIEKLQGHYDVAFAYISGEILYYVSEKVEADKKIVWIHNDYREAKHPKRYDLPHLEKMDKIVSISDRCVDIIKEEFPHLSDRVLMIPNITSSSVVHNRAEEFYPSEYDEKKFKILSIGRLVPQKGFDIAIDAAKILKERGVKFCWYIVGEGEEREKLEKQIKENYVEDFVKLLGSKENPYPYIKNCDLFAQTSRYEGKSVVLDEAKILAKPILVTNYPTVADQIKKNIEGYIVELNAKGIADGIEILIKDFNMLNMFRENLSKKEYGNQEVVKYYYTLIEE